MRANTYHWVNNSVLVLTEDSIFEESNLNLVQDAFCVDGEFSDNEARYGKFLEEGDWEHIPLDQFPPEFRVQLLLLGVS